MEFPSNKYACEHLSLSLSLPLAHDSIRDRKLGALHSIYTAKCAALTMKFISILNSNWIWASGLKNTTNCSVWWNPLAKRNFRNRLVMSSVFSLSLSFLRHKDGVATQQFLIIYGSGCLGAGDRTGAGTHETAGWWLNISFPALASSPLNIQLDWTREK